MKHPPQETNKLKRAWIRFWYNDITRLLFVLLPGHYLFTLPILVYFGVDGEIIKSFAMFSYVLVFCAGMCFSDYTNLHRIGRDTNGNPWR